MGETRAQRAGLIARLANLDPYPESVPINHLVQVEGTPLFANAARRGRARSARVRAHDRGRAHHDAEGEGAPVARGAASSATPCRRCAFSPARIRSSTATACSRPAIRTSKPIARSSRGWGSCPKRDVGASIAGARERARASARAAGLARDAADRRVAARAHARGRRPRSRLVREQRLPRPRALIPRSRRGARRRSRAGAWAPARRISCAATPRRTRRWSSELAAFVAPCADARAMSFSSGYLANLAILTALAGRGDAVFADRLNHACLNDGALLSRARTRALRALRRRRACAAPRGDERAAQDHRHRRRVQHGRRRGAAAAAAGARGASRRVARGRRRARLRRAGRRAAAALAHFGLASERIVYMGTLGKAAGVAGAFVAAHPAVDRNAAADGALLHLHDRRAAAARRSRCAQHSRVIRDDDARRARLHALDRAFREGARELPWPLLPSSTAIQPLDRRRCGAAAALVAARWPSAALGARDPPADGAGGTARLRVSLSAAHTDGPTCDALLRGARGSCDVDARRPSLHVGRRGRRAAAGAAARLRDARRPVRADRPCARAASSRARRRSAGHGYSTRPRDRYARIGRRCGLSRAFDLREPATVPRLVVRRARRAAHRALAARRRRARSSLSARRRASSRRRLAARDGADDAGALRRRAARLVSAHAAALSHAAGARQRRGPRDARFACATRCSRAARRRRATLRRCCDILDARPTCAPCCDAIATPALVITGARDALTPAAAGAWLARRHSRRALRRRSGRRARAVPVAPRRFPRHASEPFSMSTPSFPAPDPREVDPRAVRRAFARAAATYDAAAALQREVATRMAQRLEYVKLSPAADPRRRMRHRRGDRRARHPLSPGARRRARRRAADGRSGPRARAAGALAAAASRSGSRARSGARRSACAAT